MTRSATLARVVSAGALAAACNGVLGNSDHDVSADASTDTTSGDARAGGDTGSSSGAGSVCATDGGAGAAAYRLDYQTGDFSQWAEQQDFRSAQEAIVTSPARGGYPDTARFIVAPGDYTNGGTTEERGEVAASETATGNPTQGQTTWYAWSTYIPSGTIVDSDAVSPVGNGWLIFTQWLGTGASGGPVVSFGLSKGPSTPHLIIDATTQEWVQPDPIPLGVWNDFVVGVTWGETAAVGRITVKMSGTTLVDNVACANLFSGQSAYMKQGIYRSASKQTHTIYHTATRVGPTEASVALCSP